MLAPKLIVFDLDGTLVPTMQGFADIAARVISDIYGWDIKKSRQAYLETSGIPFLKQLGVLFPEDHRNQKASDQFEERKREVFLKERLSRSTYEALKELKTRGHLLGVSSNNFEHLVQFFIQRDAQDVFDQAYGYRENFSKGEDHFKSFRDEFGVDYWEILFVADSLSDLKLACQLGIPFLAIEGTFERQAFRKIDPSVPVLSSIDQLPSFLESRMIEKNYGRYTFGCRTGYAAQTKNS